MMKILLRTAIFIAFIFSTRSAFAQQPCDLNATTANFASQLSAAQPGQTLCLATGNYGGFSGAQKSSPGVTITAAAGAAPTMSLQIRQTTPVAQWIILDRLTIQGGEISAPANNLTIQNSTITDKVNIWQNAKNNACSGCPAMNNSNILFNNDLFNMANNQSGAGGYEGRLNFVNGGSNDPTPAGVTVENSQFTTGCADGVDILSGGYGVTIGPGNEFFNLQQGSCGPHIDSIQFVGSDNTGPLINANYFHDNSTGIVGYDYANDATITNNVLVRVSQSVLGGNATGTISHNTVIGTIGCGQTHQGDVCRSAIINNIATDITLTGGGAGAPSQLDYNFCTSGACPGGTHNVAGTPKFVGGANPNTYAGFALTAGSLGHNAGNDGKDIGIDAGSSSSSQPAAPTNLTATAQ